MATTEHGCVVAVSAVDAASTEKEYSDYVDGHI